MLSKESSSKTASASTKPPPSFNDLSTTIDNSSGNLAQEAATIIALFQPSDVFRLLGFNKKQRRYLCYDCHRACGEFSKALDCDFAVLRPNKSGSTTLYCFVCDAETEIQRVKCKDSDCKGDVIHDDHVCLTCGANQPF
jgi:hypothetical protein